MNNLIGNAILVFNPCAYSYILTTSGNVYDANASPAFNTTIIPELLRLYPDDPTIGSPYDPVGTSKSDRFYGPTNQYKRIASILGDVVFNSGVLFVAVAQYMGGHSQNFVSSRSSSFIKSLHQEVR